jgi:hypothetical protein
MDSSQAIQLLAEIEQIKLLLGWLWITITAGLAVAIFSIAMLTRHE